MVGDHDANEAFSIGAARVRTDERIPHMNSGYSGGIDLPRRRLSTPSPASSGTLSSDEEAVSAMTVSGVGARRNTVRGIRVAQIVTKCCKAAR